LLDGDALSLEDGDEWSLLAVGDDELFLLEDADESSLLVLGDGDDEMVLLEDAALGSGGSRCLADGDDRNGVRNEVMAERPFAT